MGRLRFVLLLVISALVVAGVATFVARGGGTPKKPAPAAANGLGDDDANVMRLLQRQKLAQAGK